MSCSLQRGSSPLLDKVDKKNFKAAKIVHILYLKADMVVNRWSEVGAAAVRGQGHILNNMNS